MGVLLGGQLSSRIFSLVLLVFFLFVPFRVGAEEIIKKGEVLNLERCVGIALEKQPNIIAAMKAVNIKSCYPPLFWFFWISRGVFRVLSCL